MFDEVDGAGVDSEQKIKESETLQLLVTAGYFRARIKGLATFDKVIGGMTWCIQGCSIDIDIDLLFQESWNIGKKIALTEKIVRVLKKMKCPHSIEPHQIQGSDFIHIYPVVQWLVKQTLGRQDERMSELKQMSCNYFDRNGQFNEEIKEEDEKSTKWSSNEYPFEDCTNFLEYINKCYWPQRTYKKPANLRNSEEEEVSVISTLLEYGKKQFLGKLSPGKAEGDKVTAAKEHEEPTETMNNEIQEQMSTHIKETTKMAGKLISKIIDIKKDDMFEVVEEYQTKSNILMQTSGTATITKLEAVQRAIGEMNGELEKVQEQTKIAHKKLEKLHKNHIEIENSNKQKENEIREVEKKIAESVAVIPENVNVEEVEEMVKHLDSLKERDTSLKESIKIQDEELNKELQLAEESETAVEDEDRVEEMQQKLDHEKKRLQMGRQRLAKTTRELKQLELFIDSIPSKREIQQYQKRFVELNEQINLAYSENKQLYDLYNILDSVKDCLQREVNLLNSIHENFKEAMQSNSVKEQMIKQMEQVGNTIRDLKKNGEHQMERTKAERDVKKSEYSGLLDKNRQYIKVTKQLQETWQLYDRLMTRAHELGLQITVE